MEKLINKMLHTEFERYATADLNRPLTADNGVLDGVNIQKLYFKLFYTNVKF